MPTDLVKFSAFTGKNNRKRIWELDTSELYTATNVDVDSSGRVRRRRGYTSVLSADVHSLFSDGTICLGVVDDDLVKINTNYTTTSLLAAVGSATMYYAPVNDIVVYTNGTEIGYIKNSIQYSFPTPTDEFKSAVQAGTLIEHFNGRLYIVIDKVFFWTDILSQRFGCIDLRQNGRQFSTSITLLKAVGDGLYLSDGDAIYFAQGTDPYEMQLRKVLNYGAVKGMWCEIPGGTLTPPVSGKVLAIGTEKGICIAMDGGVIQNVTEQHYTMPSDTMRSMLFRNDDGMDQIILSQATTSLVLTLPTFNRSEYTNYNFNSMCYFNSKYLGATSSGVFELTGNDDNATDISSTVQTGMTDFGTSLLKNIPDAYFGIDHDGYTYMNTITDHIVVSSQYEIPYASSDIGTKRVKLAKGTRSRYWGIRVTNTRPLFEIDSIELRPAIQTRRI